ncbi:hypothetical protein BS78_07G098700 [Paspalum vaginatum]|nr:hypothetical protein BS78_07G098700 [Paspalum vaginatum]
MKTVRKIIPHVSHFPTSLILDLDPGGHGASSPAAVPTGLSGLPRCPHPKHFSSCADAPYPDLGDTEILDGLHPPHLIDGAQVAAQSYDASPAGDPASIKFQVQRGWQRGTVAHHPSFYPVHSLFFK